MLIRNTYHINESTTILENATYLSEYESIISPYSIPVVENTRLGTNIVSYEDIERLCEEYGWSTQKAINSIANSNHIDDLVVAVDESTVVATPYIVNQLDRYVVVPMSENHIVSQFVDYCVQSFIESGDIEWMNICVEPESILMEADEAEQTAETTATPAAEPEKYDGEAIRKGWETSRKAFEEKQKNAPDPLKPGFLAKLKKYLMDKPRNFIARMATRLRGLYKNFLNKAQHEKDQNQIKWYKNIARIILKGIDWVVNKLQNFHVDYDKRTAEFDKKVTEFNNKNKKTEETK